MWLPFIPFLLEEFREESWCFALHAQPTGVDIDGDSRSNDDQDNDDDLGGISMALCNG